MIKANDLCKYGHDNVGQCWGKIVSITNFIPGKKLVECLQERLDTVCRGHRLYPNYQMYTPRKRKVKHDQSE